MDSLSDNNSKNELSSMKWFIGIVFAITLSYALGILTTQVIQLASRSAPINSGISEQVSIEDIDSIYINRVLERLSSEYLGEYPDTETLTYGAIKGIVESMGDKYTSFLDPEESEAYFSSANNEFEGVGIVLGTEDSYTIVETVLEGNPADKAGLLSGDYITDVDEASVIGMSPYEVASLIRGEAGTEVKLTVYRSSTDDTLVFDVERARIDLENLDWEMLDENIAHISIYRFTEDSVRAFNQNWDSLVDEVVAAGPDSIVIDLRNNPGGYVDSVRYVAEEFLSNGEVIFAEEYRSGNIANAVDQRSGQFEDIPVVVLVNQGSASASEIFAAAIQDNNRGQVVGLETVGKGVEQKLVQLDDGSLLIVVFRRWLTPDGKNISADDPIIPDILIENTLDEDLQLNKAIELLVE